MSWFHYKIASSLILLYNIPNPFPFQTKHPILINTVYNWRRGYWFDDYRDDKHSVGLLRVRTVNIRRPGYHLNHSFIWAGEIFF